MSLRIPLIIFLSVLIFHQNLHSQIQLEKYVEEGIANNIVLKQKRISLQKALYALKIASSYFLPSIEFEGDYTSGEGGRNISVPVGDMLNPVYRTLNQLTQSNRFPQLSNFEMDFFPYHFYDVKVRTTLPVLNTDIILNNEIQSDEVHLYEFEVDVYKRELVKEIKTAYFNYLSSLAAKKIYQNSLSVALEGKRVNESLLNNGKGLPVYILRSESEISEINSQIVEADNQIQTTGRYFNFILNKSLDAVIDTSFNVSFEINIIDKILNDEYDLSKREELKMLETGKNINESALLMNKLYWVPKLNAFLDLGAQDQGWKFDSGSRYYLVGLQLSVPIFEAFRNSYKINTAELEVNNSLLNIELTKSQIKLSQSISRGNLIAAKQNYYTAVKKYETALSYEKLIEKGYKEGVNTFIETVDSHSQLTQAALMLNINVFKVLSTFADYERETANSRINY